jgi:hypothetical protein
MHDSVEFFQINVKSWGAEKEIGIAPENGVVILYKRQLG